MENEDKLTISQFITLILDQYSERIEDYKHKIDLKENELAKLGSNSELSAKEKEKERKECREAIEFFKRRIAELRSKSSALREAMSRLDAIAKDEALSRLFISAMHELDNQTSKEEEKLFVDTATLWRQAIRKKSIFKSQQEREESRDSHKKKVDRDKMGEIINKSADEEKNSYINKYDMGRKLLGRLSEIAAENNIYFDDLANRYFNQREDAYVAEHPSIDMAALEHQKDFLKNPVDYYSFDIPGYVGVVDEMRKCLRCIDILKEKYLTSKYSEIEKYAKAIVELAREIEYVDRLLVTFDVLPLNKTSIYLDAREVSQKQKEQYGKLVAKIRELMAKENFKGIIEAVDRLEELYREISSKYERMRKLRQAFNENSSIFPLTDLEKEIRDIKIEMHQLVTKYPQLAHRQEFFSILKDYDDSKDLTPEEDEKAPTLEEPKQTLDAKQTVEIEEEMTDKTDEDTARAELSDDLSNKEDTEELEEDTFEQIELPVALQVTRTHHYQNYMMEKVKKSPLGKIPFSEYLKQVAPDQTELIATEVQREHQAETIYKKYIKHRLAGANVSFSEYCKMFYGDVSIDIPVAYEEEEKARHK